MLGQLALSFIGYSFSFGYDKPGLQAFDPELEHSLALERGILEMLEHLNLDME